MLKLLAKAVLLAGLLTALGAGIRPVLAQAGGCMCMGTRRPTPNGGGGCYTLPDGGGCVDINCVERGGFCMEMNPKMRP